MQTHKKNVLTLPGCNGKNTRISPAKLAQLTQAVNFFFSHVDYDKVVYTLTEMAECAFIEANKAGETVRIEHNAVTEYRLKDLLEALNCFYKSITNNTLRS